MREMKDSGISWVGEIPKEWSVWRNKYIFKITKDIVLPSKSYQLLSLTTTGIKEKDENDNGGKVPENYDGYQVVKENDLVMCLFDLDCSAVFSGLSPYNGMISPAYKVLKVKKRIANEQYYRYWFNYVGSKRFYKQYSKSLRFTLNADEFNRLFSLLPPLDEQQRIAEFLDRECGKIDGLKADIQAQIDALEQYKRSVITETVTHGLNPSAPMKDSGIPWVDEVPQNWGIRRVKYIATCLKKGNGITKEDIVEDGDTLCIRYGEIYTKYNLSFFECTTRTNKERISSKQYFTQGDILFAGTGELIEEIGKNIVYLGTGDCLAGGDIIILKHKQNARYLNYALNSECVQAQKSCNKAKLKVVHISAFEIGNIKIALPPLDEQQEIADYLDNKCAEIEQIIADKKSQIETLDGYKKSLIFEYVTGKKEVG